MLVRVTCARSEKGKWVEVRIGRVTLVFTSVSDKSHPRGQLCGILEMTLPSVVVYLE